MTRNPLRGIRVEYDGVLIITLLVLAYINRVPWWSPLLPTAIPWICIFLIFVTWKVPELAHRSGFLRYRVERALRLAPLALRREGIV